MNTSTRTLYLYSSPIWAYILFEINLKYLLINASGENFTKSFATTISFPPTDSSDIQNKLPWEERDESESKLKSSQPAHQDVCMHFLEIKEFENYISCLLSANTKLNFPTNEDLIEPRSSIATSDESYSNLYPSTFVENNSNPVAFTHSLPTDTFNYPIGNTINNLDTQHSGQMPMSYPKFNNYANHFYEYNENPPSNTSTPLTMDTSSYSGFYTNIPYQLQSPTNLNPTNLNALSPLASGHQSNPQAFHMLKSDYLALNRSDEPQGPVPTSQGNIYLVNPFFVSSSMSQNDAMLDLNPLVKESGDAFPPFDRVDSILEDNKLDNENLISTKDLIERLMQATIQDNENTGIENPAQYPSKIPDIDLPLPPAFVPPTISDYHINDTLLSSLIYKLINNTSKKTQDNSNANLPFSNPPETPSQYSLDYLLSLINQNKLEDFGSFDDSRSNPTLNFPPPAPYGPSQFKNGMYYSPPPRNSFPTPWPNFTNYPTYLTPPNLGDSASIKTLYEYLIKILGPGLNTPGPPADSHNPFPFNFPNYSAQEVSTSPGFYPFPTLPPPHEEEPRGLLDSLFNNKMGFLSPKSKSKPKKNNKKDNCD